MSRSYTYVNIDTTENERSRRIGYIKGKSTLLIFDRHADMKYKYAQRQFWCRGYFVDTVGKNAKAIQEYIANQLKEDK